MSGSIFLRDSLIYESWKPTTILPPPDERGRHFPVQLWGVIDDERFHRVQPGPFSDVVSFWPALGIWTVTLQSRGAPDPVETEVRVILWQPLPPVPKSWP